MPFRCLYGLNLLTQIKRNYGGPTMPLEQAQRELIQGKGGTLINYSTSAKSKGAEPTESIVQILVIDPKEKGLSRFLLASHIRRRSQSPQLRKHPKRRSSCLQLCLGQKQLSYISFFVLPDVGLYA